MVQSLGALCRTEIVQIYKLLTGCIGLSLDSCLVSNIWVGHAGGKNIAQSILVKPVTPGVTKMYQQRGENSIYPIFLSDISLNRF